MSPRTHLFRGVEVIAAIAGIGATAACAPAAGPRPPSPPRPRPHARSVPRALPATRAPRPVAGVDEIPVGGGRVFPERRVVVTQPTAGEFRGFGIVCTHDGCELNAVADGTINCPCHGSRYAIADGSVVQGPARTGLRVEQVAVDGDPSSCSDPLPHVRTPHPPPVALRASRRTPTPTAAPRQQVRRPHAVCDGPTRRPRGVLRGLPERHRDAGQAGSRAAGLAGARSPSPRPRG